MSKKELPFYTQAALLDRYIKNIDLDKDAEIIKVIVDVLEKREDLRRYFFRNRPSANWAKILWNNNLLNVPPSLNIIEGGIQTWPLWDGQRFLIDVANEVPEIVVNHVEGLNAPPWYISQAISALIRIPPNYAVKVIERIIFWLNSEETAAAIRDEVYDYAALLSKSGYFDEALAIFSELTKPRLISQYKTIDSQVTVFDPVFNLYSLSYKKDFSEVNVFEELSKSKPEAFSMILLDQLDKAINLEAEAIGNLNYVTSSWWRIAVEATGQDGNNSTKDVLLGLLLHVLDYWGNKDFNSFQQTLKKLLIDKRRIFYRIGLYFLQKYAERMVKNVENELVCYMNLDNTEIRHEYFLLLENGFQYLSSEKQFELITMILNGPRDDKLEKIRSYYSPDMKMSAEEYILVRRDIWIRDRLWMIQKNLNGDSEGKFQELIDKYGHPDHPTFHSWMTDGGFVKSVSPISKNEILKLSPQQLISYIENWHTESTQEFLLEERNFEGLGQEVANVIYENMDVYRASLLAIARTQPSIAYQIIDRFYKSELISSDHWKTLLDLCEQILSDEEIRTSVKRGYEADWTWVRISIAKLIQKGFSQKSNSIPELYWKKSRDILLILVDDPDPEEEPKPGINEGFGINDPITLSLNHIRPIALSALIDYECFRAKQLENDNKEEYKIENEVQQAFSRKLDKTNDKSLSVHSVFGRYLPSLYWLSQEWVENNINSIFPEIVDQDSLWFFQSAWDAFIFNKPFLTILRDLLLPKYLTAIETLSHGFTTRKDVVANFANHLVFDFLLNDYGEDLHSNELVPLIRFFKKTSAENRSKGAFACCSVLEKYPDMVDEWWPKIRKIWEWRVQEAVADNHSSDFDEEVRNFSDLPNLAPDHESVVSLWPLLEGMLPHVVNMQHRFGSWEHVERFLANQVKTYPLEVIQLYSMMREQRGEIDVWRKETDEAITIISTAVENIHSRKEALTLIDLLASLGNYDYQYLYNRYTK